MTRRDKWVVVFMVLTLALAGLTACTRNHANSENQGASDNQRTEDEKARERAEKTRERAADLAQRAKPALQRAGKRLDEGARAAAEQARAAAQGIREGWNRNQAVDLNSASEDDLLTVPGITRQDARKIMDGRPYHSKEDLVTKGIISADRYEAIRDRVIVK